MNHGIQVIHALNARFPGIKISSDPPGENKTSWWYDLEYNGRIITVEWNPYEGFGLYEKMDPFQGVPDEVFPDFETFARKVGENLIDSGSPELLWSGHLRDYSGYGKASREILFRVSNVVRVRVDQSDIEQEPSLVDDDTAARIDAYTRVPVSDRAPLLRFYTPKKEIRESYRICFTMMETSLRAHPEFISLLNGNYDECWTPTSWGRQVFIDSGLKIPCLVQPLGVSKHIYRPIEGCNRPKAMLLSGARAGTSEIPEGFAFLGVFDPTFRKGVETLVAAFDRAFAGNDGVCLVLFTGAHKRLTRYGCAPFSKIWGGMARSRIYHISGIRSEWGMARLYNSFDCYVTSSRGEGFALPLVEAASCGLPVIASACSSHPEVLEGLSSGVWMFDPSGYEAVPGTEKLCRWYEDQKFATFGPKAIESLSGILKAVATGKKATIGDRQQRSEEIRNLLSWDVASDRILKRILEIWEKS